jgi:8-oxo-dGTP pyrophosphatase MutT (NUDIX family)
MLIPRIFLNIRRCAYSTATSTMASSKPAAVPARPSASLIIVSPRNRILLLQRTANLSFALAHVFPGGVLSSSDNGNARVCALRETFEETGLLLTTTAPPPSVSLAEAQVAVHSGQLDFQSWIKSWGGQLLPPFEVRPFTTWITPPNLKRRYESQMFITTLPGWISEDDVVAGDGGKEVVGAKWIAPREAMRMARDKEIVLFPPQMYLVNHVAECLTEGGKDEERQALWERVREVGSYICEPRREGVTEDGAWVMGLGKRGDNSVNVLLEMPKGQVGEPRAVGVVKKGQASKL